VQWSGSGIGIVGEEIKGGKEPSSLGFPYRRRKFVQMYDDSGSESEFRSNIPQCSAILLPAWQMLNILYTVALHFASTPGSRSQQTMFWLNPSKLPPPRPRSLVQTADISEPGKFRTPNSSSIGMALCQCELLCKLHVSDFDSVAQSFYVFRCDLW
jgi:hypothetical protein